MYIICNTGSDTSQAEPQANDYSVLVRFDETAQTFTAGRTISTEHFVYTSPHLSGTDVMVFGEGPNRASDIYLLKTPANSFWSGTGTQYFSGLVNGQPTWSDTESDAVPVVQDNPTGGPAWPNDSPTVGNDSIVYSIDLGLWLMTYDGGRQTHDTTGVYFTYAKQPWGPWATPQLIFNRKREHAYGLGGFIHNPSVLPDPPGDGLNGPTIGSNDPYTTAGGEFAPLMIERFTTVSGNTLRIYYTMSTWNPYTVVKMRSEFTIAPAPAISVTPASKDYGNVKVKRSRTASFKVTNGGKANLTLSISMTGPDASMFTIQGGGGSKTIKPGKSLTVKVAFKPTSTGSKSSTLEIASNDPVTSTLDIPLIGTGQQKKTQYYGSSKGKDGVEKLCP